MPISDQKPQSVEQFDACPPDDQCPHCAAGRPEAPETAGVPADLSSATWEVETDAQRFALPPTYHRPNYIDTLRPPGWFCAACWGDGVLTDWPCKVADRHATYVQRAIREERQGLGHTIAVLTREMQDNHEAVIAARNERDKAQQERDSLARRCAVRFEETEKLRAELETMTAIAQGNKRHVADMTYQLERVEALTKDAAGNDLNGAEIVVAGKIRRALYEPLPDTRPKPCCEFHDRGDEPCAPDDLGGYCCDNCPTLAAAATAPGATCPSCTSDTRTGPMSGRLAIDQGDGPEWCDDEWHDQDEADAAPYAGGAS